MTVKLLPVTLLLFVLAFSRKGTPGSPDQGPNPYEDTGA